jgi:glycosyltransferase involved in cell wall biosynthesis
MSSRPPVRPRVVVVHDYLTQRGGAERVALALLQSFPDARLLTSVYAPELTYEEFGRYDVETLWLQQFRQFRRDPRYAFPLLGLAFSGHAINDADLVICSTSGWAHAVRSSAPKLVYCHNPARWLYQPQDYFKNSAMLKYVTSIIRAPLKVHDFRWASSAEVYIANSSIVSERIRQTYGLNASVIHPPAGIDPEGLHERIPGIEPGYILNVSRARSYKNTLSLCEAVTKSPHHRLVVVGGLPSAPAISWPDRMRGLTDLNDAQMRWLYENCTAIAAVGREDFGLTPVEGYLFGKPAIATRSGGYLDTVVEGVTGMFAESSHVHDLEQALRHFDHMSFDPQEIRRRGQLYTTSAFVSNIRREAGRILRGECRNQGDTKVRDDSLKPLDLMHETATAISHEGEVHSW